MEATYAGGRRLLHEDDQRGITFLYPASGQTGSISGTVAGSNGPIVGATVSIGATPVFAITLADGTYSAEGIPDIGTYSVTAVADGFESATTASVFVGQTADFVLTPLSGGGGDDPSGCVPKGPFGLNCK